MAPDPFEAFFRPESIFLVVGASDNTEKYGAKVFLDLRAAGYNVVAINKNVEQRGVVLGTPAYPSLSAFLARVGELFDEGRRADAVRNGVVVLVVPPPAALAVVQEAAALGFSKAWFQPGSESDEAIAFCKEHDITEVHGQCVMVQKPGA